MEQTEILIENAKNVLFKGQPLPPEYVEAFEEYEKVSKKLHELLVHDQYDAANVLANLKVTKLLRPSVTELAYDFALHAMSNDELLFKADKNLLVWTNSFHEDVAIAVFPDIPGESSIVFEQVESYVGQVGELYGAVNMIRAPKDSQ